MKPSEPTREPTTRELPAQERYSSVAVPTPQGSLHVGVWAPATGGDQAPTVLAVHGVTANHRCWAFVADRLPELRILAPDLRGRG
jgi:pimeloyl-ACP methyl ester carboxylesterase